MRGLKSIFGSSFLRLAQGKKAEFDPAAAPEMLRKRFDKLAGDARQLGADITTSPIRAGSAPAEWVQTATSRTHRVILYLHGGGYVMGSPLSHRLLVGRLCLAAGARGLLLNYRLAPEHPFPAALDDTLEAYRWLLGTGIAPEGIALVGDSSGGGLALSAAMAIRDEGLPQPAAIAMMSPWVDLSLSSWSLLLNDKSDRLLSLEMLAWCARHYLNGEIPTNPLASPLWGDFRGLPPMLIHVGAQEILKDDAKRLAHKADLAGIDVSIEVWDRVVHAFQFFPEVPEAQGAIDRIGSFVRSRTTAEPVVMPDRERVTELRPRRHA